MTPLLTDRPEAGLCVTRLNRPQHPNAMDQPLLRKFHAALDRLVDDPTVRVIVLARDGAPFPSRSLAKDRRRTRAGGVKATS